MNGSQVGNGYIFGDLLHYHIRVGDAYVEVGYRGTERGMLVTGSSTKNAQGRFIAWQETLEKAGSWKRGEERRDKGISQTGGR
jgi:hypothetical protein